MWKQTYQSLKRNKLKNCIEDRWVRRRDERRTGCGFLPHTPSLKGGPLGAPRGCWPGGVLGAPVGTATNFFFFFTQGGDGGGSSSSSSFRSGPLHVNTFPLLPSPLSCRDRQHRQRQRTSRTSALPTGNVKDEGGHCWGCARTVFCSWGIGGAGA